MWLNILLFFIGVFTFFYWYITKEFGYFKARGVVEAPASFPFGSEPARNMFTGKNQTAKNNILTEHIAITALKLVEWCF